MHNPFSRGFLLIFIWFQIQQSTKKNNKIHQDMKKKIAKLESKIKSMDKVTVRRGTQTENHFDKVFLFY